MKITSTISDAAALGELAQRVQRARLDRQMTQADLAAAAGVARPTIERFEASGSAQLTTLIRVLRALDLMDRFDAILPATTIRPIEALETRGRGRRRASHRRKVEATVKKAWTWGDQGVSTFAEVILWGTRIGVVQLPEDSRIASFQYDPDFLQSDIEVSPLVMPLSAAPCSFPGLPPQSFHGLPGLLANSLPDKYGNALIDAWLASKGRLPDDFNAVERLSYTGSRGMGALEFRPVTGPQAAISTPVNIDALVNLASEVLTHRQTLNVTFAGDGKAEALREILRVGTSAGGARAKAVIAWNPATNEVRSGQMAAPPGFEFWLIKFDGVQGNKDKDLADPQGFGAVEYAYSQMALAAGVEMTATRLFEEGGRRHFMTKRFDRTDTGDKLHMQSLAALDHYDFNSPGAYAYEQAFLAIRQLRLPVHDVEQQFRRMAFNILARNQDDHVKNIAFLMDRSGTWRLSPAFDVIWAYNPTGAWTSQHQMSVNGKRDEFVVEDVMACARSAGISTARARTMLGHVRDAVAHWPEFARAADVKSDWIIQIGASHRLGIVPAATGSRLRRAS